MITQKGAYYYGKPHFCINPDLENVFLSSWVKYKIDVTPNQMDKKRKSIHDAVENYRKRDGKKYHKVKRKLNLKKTQKTNFTFPERLGQLL